LQLPEITCETEPIGQSVHVLLSVTSREFVGQVTSLPSVKSRFSSFRSRGIRQSNHPRPKALLL